MNYGAEPADQVVRYSLEGMEYSLKITGNVAKHVAIFIAAAQIGRASCRERV